MERGRSKLAALVFAAAVLVAPAAGRELPSARRARPVGHELAQAVTQAGGESPRWLDRLQRWFAAVQRHVPGTRDQSVDALAAWTPDDLDAVIHDVTGLAAEVSRHPLPVGGSVERLTIQSRGHALPPDMIAPLVSGSGPSGGLNGFLIRAALLHTDAALVGPSGPQGSGRGGLLVAVDGQSVGFLRPTTHLYRARDLADLVKPDPAKDATVRLWYVAVASWLWNQRRFSDLDSHLYHAGKLFPRDADICLLTACFHETLASPPVQSVIESAPIPRQSISVRTASDELGLARDAFDRALEAKPGHLEARFRRAHVLAMQGKHQEAERELTAAVDAPASMPLLYYGLLFLGSEEEALGHHDAARAAYERARALFPGAQSPYLALSQLARASGDTAGAVGAAQRLFGLPATSRERLDPWWMYYANCGPDADALLADLRKPFMSPKGN